MTVRLGVVVPAYRAGEKLASCVEAVLTSDLPDGWSLHVVVVNNSPLVDLGSVASSARVRILNPGRNVGIAAGRNLGWRALLDTDIVVFIDEDIVVSENCLWLLTEYLIQNPGVGVVTPKIMYADDPAVTWAAGTLIDERTGRVRFITAVPTTKSYDVDVAPSVIGVPRDVLDYTQGFDPEFFAVYEDTDFCFRVRRQGYAVRCLTEAECLHDTPMDVVEQRRHLMSRSFWVGRNRILFMRRHGSGDFLLPLFLLAYLAYYGLTAVRIRDPRSFVQFCRGTLEGLTFPRRPHSVLARPGVMVCGLATALCIVWFHSRTIMGTGEGGSSFLRPDVNLQDSWYLWNPSGTGGTAPELVAGTPFWASIFLAWKVGFSPWLLQAAVFWSCIVIAGTSVAYLVRASGGNQVGAAVGALLYILGPYAEINVWHRFLLPYQLFFAYLPLALALMRRAYLSGKLGPAGVLVCVTPWFAISFVAPGLIFVLAGLLVLDAVGSRWMYGTSTLRTLSFATAGLLGVNLFWLVPLSLTAGSAIDTSASGSITSNVANLLGVSQSLPLGATLRSLNLFYTSGNQALPWPYDSGAALLIFYLIPLFGLAAIMGRKSRPISYLVAAAALGLFLAKGSASPAGGLFVYVLRHVQLAGVFRNPYERLGFIYYLFVSILVGLAVSKVRLNSWRSRASVSCVAIALMTVIGIPSIDGSVFSTRSFGTYRLSVPSAYSVLPALLNQGPNSDTRTVIAPVAQEGISYRWPAGYRGADVMPTLDPDSLSMLSGTPLPTGGGQSLKAFPIDPSSVALARLLGVRYVAVRQDIVAGDDGLLDPTLVDRTLRTSRNFQHMVSLGRLDVFRLRGCVYPRVFASQRALPIEQPTLSQLVGAANADCTATVSLPSAGAAIGGLSVGAPSPVFALPSKRLASTAYAISVPADFRGWIGLNEAWAAKWSARLAASAPSCPALLLASCMEWGSRHASTVTGPVVADGYANAWYVSTNKAATLLLLYRPQRYVEWGFISSTAVMAALLCFGLSKRRSVWRPQYTKGWDSPSKGS
jgi:GT2 family glycosyltransferase